MLYETKDITQNKIILCPYCGGTGSTIINRDKLLLCFVCEGSGKVKVRLEPVKMSED